MKSSYKNKPIIIMMSYTGGIHIRNQLITPQLPTRIPENKTTFNTDIYDPIMQWAYDNK
jgi:hypothetical protein